MSAPGLAWCLELQPIWNSTLLNTLIKIHLFNSIVIPTSLYVSETWQSTNATIRQLNVLQQRGLRRIWKILGPDNEQRGATKSRHSSPSRYCCSTLILVCRKIPLPTPSLASQSCHDMVSTCRGKRKRGGPKITWCRTIIDDLEHASINLDEAEAIAADHQRWKSIAGRCTAWCRRSSRLKKRQLSHLST